MTIKEYIKSVLEEVKEGEVEMEFGVGINDHFTTPILFVDPDNANRIRLTIVKKNENKPAHIQPAS